MAILNSAGKIVEANEALSQWLEKSPDKLVGELFWDVLVELSPDWREPLTGAAKDAAPFGQITLKLASPGSSAQQWFALELARQDGTCFVRLNSILPPLSALEEHGWDEHLRNDSARREMYMRLLRAEAQLENLMRRWPCVILSQRPDFSVQFASPNIEDLTGISVSRWAVQPHHFWRVVHELDADELQQQFRRAVQTGASITNTYRIRHAMTGRVAHILEHRHPTLSPNGLLLGYEVVWVDVTRQTVAEKRLSTAAWKETLAVLTLGMAHDFRNIMAGIHSLSESYLAQVDKQHAFHEGLGLIKSNSMQASQLVQRMIDLHLGQTGERAYHNLNDVAMDLVELIRKILPRRIKVGMEFAAGQLPVYADIVELRQVVINLLLNAADAMPQGGTLTLRTSRHEQWPAPEHFKGIVPRLPCVCLTIQDTGSGIKQRHLGLIFDPFFTTKSKGSGLGLYNARLAVEKHQGAISVESREGVGTSFRVWLPEADFSESTRNEMETRRKRATRRNLLLAGQDGEMIEKTAEFLRSHNYLVVLATTVESVPELLQSGDYQFAGVMLLAEPKAPGLSAMLAEVRQQKKELRVALKLAGCNQDELDGQLVKDVNLILNSDLPHADILGKLEALLNTET